jgi:hypothetical protein
MHNKKLIPATLLLAAAMPIRADAGTLRGSPSSMEQQHAIAVEEDLTFTEKPSQIGNLVDSGALVNVEANEDFALSKVSYPYARPEVLLFIQRVASQYHADNGVKLVVTSLTRPADLQPRNAHELSVHPAGMAVDFRVPSTAAQRAWLEKALLGLENARVLDVTRERYPPHYHVAVFPAEYLAYAKKRMALEPAPAKKKIAKAPTARAAAVSPGPVTKTNREDDRAPLLALSLITLAVVAATPAAVRRISSH